MYKNQELYQKIQDVMGDGKPKSFLYVFYHKHVTNRKIVIYAMSYMEAKQMLNQSFYLSNEYNLTEYRLLKVDTEALFDILGIDYNLYGGYPSFITESQFEELQSYIVNKSDTMINHTYALTRDVMNKHFGYEDNCKLPNINELTEYLSEQVKEKERTRKEILDMLTYAGDIWYSKTDTTVAYGKNRMQLEKLGFHKQFLLVHGTTKDTIAEDDMERYNEMKEYMLKRNVKKFPFKIYLKTKKSTI